MPIDEKRRLRRLYKWAKFLGPGQPEAASADVLVPLPPPRPSPKTSLTPRLRSDASPSELMAALDAKIAREVAA